MIKKIKLLCCLMIIIAFIFPEQSVAQKRKNKAPEETKHPLEELNISAFKFRSIGSAMTSGRIADIAVHPDNPFVYYVATASGGVWKTVNAGTTFKPIFDSQGSYSIGCITIDPSNPNIIWVGTGENNNQRSVSYGDGVYKSTDGGASWEHVGLKTSEHIGKIIVHPDDSNKVFVAAIGPLWRKGGDRGVYKTTDGGENWEAVLTIDDYTGVTDLVMDLNDPDVLYAAAFQRMRHVFTYLGGGPGSGMHKTTDGGASWTKINKGLPSSDIGRIGLSISPANPDYIYAIVEAQKESGVYRSENKGASWKKRGGYVTSGNYYQEIVTDPHEPNTLYGLDTWMKVSKDGGKSFINVGEDTKHVDNHSMWIDPNNNAHWLVGCDGGIYETFDAATTWDFKSNLPVTQFYKVSTDNDAPFYNIFGGTQDNFSLGGPSRTNTAHGIVNSDWFITHGGDGFETQVDPNNPNIIYAQSQYGVLFRYDKLSGEETGIQPKERKDEEAYRWNWDAPLVASPHKAGRIYFAANKVFRSDDYGNSWEVLSDDLSRQLDRNELKIMDRVWSVDAVNKNRSTSPYGAVVAFSESVLNENLLVAGTDDGLIHVSEDGGENWKKIDNISGVPQRTYVNAVYASQHDENVMYAAFNHHKYGDFKPYLFKSTNKGVSWQKISNNLPEMGSVYAIEEDHVNKDLLFCGTEFGVFFSPNGGNRWRQLKAGVPTVAVRDIAIQRRENDLVLGTFGRGFFVLDDYSALRNLGANGLEGDARIFDVRSALSWEESKPLGLPGKSFQGDSFYAGENLGPVVMIDYFVKEDLKSIKDKRKEKEKKAIKDGQDTPYPSYEELKKEREEIAPELVFTIKDDAGNVVRKLTKKPSKGLQRLIWDLRYVSKDPISFRGPSFYNPFADKPEGSLVKPGTYEVSMAIVHGETKSLGEPVTFEVKTLSNMAIPVKDAAGKVAFKREVAELSRNIQGANRLIGEMENKLRHIAEAIKRVEEPMDDLQKDFNNITEKLRNLDHQLNSDPVKRKLDIDQPPTPSGRIGWIGYEQKYSSADVTQTHRDSYAIAKDEFAPIAKALKQLVETELEALEDKLEQAGAGYTPGRGIRD